MGREVEKKKDGSNKGYEAPYATAYNRKRKNSFHDFWFKRDGEIAEEKKKPRPFIKYNMYIPKYKYFKFNVP